MLIINTLHLILSVKIVIFSQKNNNNVFPKWGNKRQLCSAKGADMRFFYYSMPFGIVVFSA